MPISGLRGLDEGLLHLSSFSWGVFVAVNLMPRDGRMPKQCAIVGVDRAALCDGQARKRPLDGVSRFSPRSTNLSEHNLGSQRSENHTSSS